MAYTLLASAGGMQTTAGVNTTGATLLVVGASGYRPFTVTDSKSNSWNALTEYGTGIPANVFCQLFWSVPTSAGSGHTFTVNDVYNAVAVLALSGAAASPFDQQNGNNDGTQITSDAPGSITPSQNAEIVVAFMALGNNGSSPSVGGGFTQTNTGNGVDGVNYGYSMAYLIQTSAAAANPTFSWSNNSYHAVTIASFKALAAVAGMVVRERRQARNRALLRT